MTPCEKRLAPGTVYTSGVTSDGTVGLFRLEVSVANDTGKLKLAGGVSGAIHSSPSSGGRAGPPDRRVASSLHRYH